MLADIQKDARYRMGKSLESLRHELAKIRTGRAHPSLLEHVHDTESWPIHPHVVDEHSGLTYTAAHRESHLHP